MFNISVIISYYYYNYILFKIKQFKRTGAYQYHIDLMQHCNLI